VTGTAGRLRPPPLPPLRGGFHPHSPDLALVLVAVEVLDAARVEGRRAPDEAVDDVALGEEDLGQVRAVLACDGGTGEGGGGRGEESEPCMGEFRSRPRIFRGDAGECWPCRLACVPFVVGAQCATAVKASPRSECTFIRSGKHSPVTPVMSATLPFAGTRSARNSAASTYFAACAEDGERGPAIVLHKEGKKKALSSLSCPSSPSLPSRVPRRPCCRPRGPSSSCRQRRLHPRPVLLPRGHHHACGPLRPERVRLRPPLLEGWTADQ
jgi:hypothetical protein